MHEAMCGIYGILELTGARARADLLTAMGRLTLHRGPDDEGIYADGPCAIGVRRLAVIDLAGGHQPLSNEDGTLWLVANGEIYNFRELRKDLEARGHQFKTHSDCETIIHLYAQYGDDFVRYLNGMFGFALWDATRKRLLLGRDRLGVKPMYVLNDGKRVAFASEAKALLTLPGVSANIDMAALDSYLTLGYVPAPQSIFAGIEKLPPATLLVVEAGRVVRRRYWSVPNDVDRSVPEKAWVEQLRLRLEESVRMQMVSDVPIGAFLSGGVDSSAVVAFMAAHSERPVKTYAIGFEGGKAEAFYSELTNARRVAALFGTEHREIMVRSDIARLLPQLLWHMDEPLADSALLTTYVVSDLARREVTVVLSGVGGDELFGGYRRYLGNYYGAHFDRLPAWVRWGVAALGEWMPSDRHSPALDFSRLAKGFLSSLALPFEERYRAYVQVFSRDVAEAMLKATSFRRSDAFKEAFQQTTSEDSLNRILSVDAQTQLPEDILLLTDKMSMAVSLECRVPLLDHELVELAARMPEATKIRRGRLKHAMKAALADLLPADVLAQRKRGFGAPIGAWLKGGLAPIVRSLLSDAAVRARGLFRCEPIRELIDAHQANRIDGTDRLLALLNLEIWCRIFLDARTPSDVADELAVVKA